MSNVLGLALFALFVLALLALDLCIFGRRKRSLDFKEALLWSVCWVVLALLFNLGVYFRRGPEAALEFLAAYVLEKSLSLDNIFVFAVLFHTYAVPAEYQHKVLFRGVLGALLMRGAFIAGGVALVERFDWVLYLFGGVLLVTGAKLLSSKRETEVPQHLGLLRLGDKLPGVAESDHQGAFIVRRQGKFAITPLFVVLILVEVADMLFALDSIPAVFGVTRDIFLIYTSNVFALLGLRSLYFLLANALPRFRYLRLGFSVILMFVGIKMLAARWIAISVGFSLLVIVVILGISIFASVYGMAGRAAQKDPGFVSNYRPKPDQ
jgi:tellurite resistance protein TerC